MEKKSAFDIIICGGGASGLLLAKALISDSAFDNLQIALIEKERKTKNDRTWCFWEEGHGHWESVITAQWTKAQFKSKGFKTNFPLDPFQYKMIRGRDFYTLLYAELGRAKNLSLFYEEILSLTPKKENCHGKTSTNSYIGQRVFSSWPQNQYCTQHKYPVLQQHFIGWFVQTEKEIFDPNCLTFMDFDLPQHKETRFMYVLPFSNKEALVEYTLFSPELLQEKAYEMAIKDYLNKLEPGHYAITEKEQGSIPMTAYDFTKHNRASLLHIGTAGGWTKASTGFTFQKSATKVKELVAFLKKDKPLNDFKSWSKFNFYDMLFLDVLDKYNAEGSALFTRMFKRNPPQRIFKFLDEKTSWRQEVLLMASFPTLRFVKALIKRLFG